MPTARHQGDLVDQFINTHTEIGQEVTDRVSLPGIESLFYKPTQEAEIKTQSVRLPDIKRLGQKSRQDIAEALVGLLSYKPGVVGFDWVIGADHIDVLYVDGLKQKVPENEEKAKELELLFATLLKTRKNIVAISWQFGESYVEISYLISL